MALTGVKVIEFAGLAPGPFAGLILADNGASVIRVDKSSSPATPTNDVLCRNKRSVAINPKIPSGLQILKKMIASADVLIDPFRPGVMERLGLGPEVFLGGNGQKGLNERLIYARMIGFPRTGPQKSMAGHDINYLALSGVLSMLPGTPELPGFPINLLADFAGGGMSCALGIILALVDRARTGKGQVVDTDMVSGARYVSSFPLIDKQLPTPRSFGGKRGHNLLDGGCPFYNVYSCKSGGHVSIGCLEPQFFRTFIEIFDGSLSEEFKNQFRWKPTPETQFALDEWPRLKEYIEKGFMTHSREEWGKIFHETDACVVPVLTPKEAGTLLGTHIPVPHPTVSGSNKVDTSQVNLQRGKHTGEVLREYGLSEKDCKALLRDGAISKL
ncbi:CoA-transferase family III [Dendrothele bispora CBS 962.96]|uniref:CoA-transferase family III n=1 Tax=Dendrothele bispora (strain CBS 962.96) TaxID=1314807 RepID=A0A4S8ML30_DENBC|nr:CoA-transferase family III [Dendrothele bispora CBS 962.96]